MKFPTLVLFLLFVLTLPNDHLRAAAKVGNSTVPFRNNIETKTYPKAPRVENKAQRLQKRLNKWRMRFEKKKEKWTKKAKLNVNFDLGFLGLMVMLLGGLFIVLGLVIPVLGVLFLVIGIIIAFAGLLLLLLLSSVSVHVSE